MSDYRLVGASGFCPCSFWSLYYLSGELWLLITPLVCSSFSCHFTGYMEDTNRWYWQIWKFCLSHEQISLIINTCTEGTERVVNDVSNPLVDEQVTGVREVSNLIISTHSQALKEESEFWCIKSICGWTGNVLIIIPPLPGDTVLPLSVRPRYFSSHFSQQLSMADLIKSVIYELIKTTNFFIFEKGLKGAKISHIWIVYWFFVFLFELIVTKVSGIILDNFPYHIFF